MNPVVVIPTFIYPRRHRGGADVVSTYDHPTAPNQEGELGRCLESLAKVEGLGLVVILVSADVSLEVQAAEKVQAIANRHPDVTTLVIGAAELALIEQRMAQLKMASEQARALVDAAPDEEDKLGAAVVRMTQEKIFNLLMDLEINAEDVDVNKLFKNAAEIGKASVTQKRFSMEARAVLKEEARRELRAGQRQKLDALGQSGEVDQGTLAKVIQAAYGL